MKKSNTITKWTFFFGAVAVALVALVYLGAYNVAASVEHYRPTEWMLSAVKDRSVAVRADSVAAPPDLKEQASRGAGAFDAMCAGCHGAPGKERSFVGKGLNPTPPELGHAAEEMSAEELFWITKHGIKMTGMPAFGETHSDEELWPVVAFLEELRALDADAYAAKVDGGGGHQHDHGGDSDKDDPGGDRHGGVKEGHNHEHATEG